MSKKTICPTCGMEWTSHPGIMETCKRLYSARQALRVIHTWADFDGGRALTPRHVVNLCEKVLKNIGRGAQGPQGDVNG